MPNNNPQGGPVNGEGTVSLPKVSHVPQTRETDKPPPGPNSGGP